MPRAAPAQVLLHDAMHLRRISLPKPERHRQRDVVAMMEHAVVVAEVHVVRTHRLSLTLRREDVARLEYFRYEHGALALRRGREKVQVLPDCAAHRARDPHVVLESRPAAACRLEYEVAHHRAALHPQSAVLSPLRVARAVADHESAKAAVAHQDVGAESQHEVLDAKLARRDHRVREIVGRRGFVEVVGGPADPERRERRQRYRELQPVCIEALGQEREGGAGGRRGWRSHRVGVAIAERRVSTSFTS